MVLGRNPSRLGLDVVALKSPLRAFLGAPRTRLSFPFPFPLVIVAATTASCGGCANLEDDLVTRVVGAGMCRERDRDFLAGGGTSAGSSDGPASVAISLILRLIRMELVD